MPYRKLACLGSGFFGEVWLEEDQALDRLCAAKYLDPARLPPGSTFAEARAMLDAEHENVVRVFSADVEAGVPVIRMEYLADGSVADRFGGLAAPVAQSLLAVEEACRGVEALHARGVLHRDLKPANLLVGDSGRIKVSDFGLACHRANLAGAPPWGYTEHLPPEAIRAGGIETAAGDIYALGVTLYRLLNGDSFMRAAAPPSSDIATLIAAGKYPDRGQWAPHLHDPLRRVVRKAMHPDPKRRHASASELRHALEAVRPVVSWTPVGASAGTTVWEGTNANGSVRFSARLGAAPRHQHVFELARQRANGAFRQCRSDAMASDDLGQVSRHVAVVLQRVARQGE